MERVVAIGFVELKSQEEEVDLALLMDRNHIGPEVSWRCRSPPWPRLQLIRRSAAAGHTPNELYKLASEKPARVGGGGRANGRERSPVREPHEVSRSVRQRQAIPTPSNRSRPRDDVGVELPLRGRRETPVVVRLEGLPYSATITDIVHFFHGFDVEYDHVRIQCREDGSPQWEGLL
eukprot:Em0115g13a